MTALLGVRGRVLVGPVQAGGRPRVLPGRGAGERRTANWAADYPGDWPAGVFLPAAESAGPARPPRRQADRGQVHRQDRRGVLADKRRHHHRGQQAQLHAREQVKLQLR